MFRFEVSNGRQLMNFMRNLVVFVENLLLKIGMDSIDSDLCFLKYFPVLPENLIHLPVPGWIARMGALKTAHDPFFGRRINFIQIVGYFFHFYHFLRNFVKMMGDDTESNRLAEHIPVLHKADEQKFDVLIAVCREGLAQKRSEQNFYFLFADVPRKKSALADAVKQPAAPGEIVFHIPIVDGGQNFRVVLQKGFCAHFRLKIGGPAMGVVSG
jgi:hypothetical protein